MPKSIPKSVSFKSNDSNSSSQERKIPNYVRSTIIRRNRSSTDQENLAVFDIKSIIRGAFNTTTCELCEMAQDPSEMLTIAKCGHLFC